jgi:hypothetical protein
MNREQRRHPERVEQPQDTTPAEDPSQEMRETGRPQDTLDPRAKNTGHKKKTADKWNQ